MISKIGNFVESHSFQNIITVLIVLNAAALGCETDPDIMAQFGAELILFDKLVLSVFTVEISFKLLNRRLQFFKNGWNVFDFVIVGIALILRIFRAMRLLSVVPSMRKVIQALFLAIPGIFSVGSIILLIFYVCSVLATNFFGAEFDEWFGSIGRSMYSLFQIMTLESWSMGIVRPVMQVHPFAWIFFVAFILVTTFAVMNLFIGIIVDAMQQQSYEEHQEQRKGPAIDSAEIYKSIIDLKDEIQDLKKMIDR
jgi:voltage-gated sodium channel